MHVAVPPSETRVDERSAMRLALVVAAAHAVNDTYASFVPPLLPRIMGDLGLSITLAATLSVAFSVAAALPQPLFGYLADRYGRRPFAVAGPVVAGVGVAAIGLAPGFWTLVLLLVIGGIGSAAFHPPGASYAVRVSAGKGGGARYSLFSFGGSVGFALGPVIAVGLVQSRGMAGLWIAMIPVVILAPFVYLALPSGRQEVRERDRPPPATPREVLRWLRGPLGLIFGVSAIMAFIQRTFLTMEPIIVAERGGSEALGALALTVYLSAQAFGTVTGGVLADRVDRRKLLAFLCFWTLPAHVLALWVGPEGVWGLMAVGLAGFMGMATLPPVVVMAQEMIPTGTAVSSGIVMGLAWATGSLFVLGTGAAADAFGAEAATLWSMPVALVAVALALHPSLSDAALRRG
ncbi:MAG: MFS transporter [Gemmatimonadetes bacterium]|nr:MFS transporter [Gemmatimonadota bacterium]NNF12846.1 MFS transporter [Gemmatimonadota bacterium]